MTVLQLLKKDHQMVKKMFEQFEGMSKRPSQKKAHLASQICQALTVHAQVEEELIYPALYEVRSKELTELLDEAAEEHQVAKTLIAELGETPSQEGRYDAKVTVLGEYVLHHVKEEEQAMFKLAKQHLSEDDLAALGEQVEARRSELMEQEEEEVEREDEQNPADKDAEEQDIARKHGRRRAA